MQWHKTQTQPACVHWFTLSMPLMKLTQRPVLKIWELFLILSCTEAWQIDENIWTRKWQGKKRVCSNYWLRGQQSEGQIIVVAIKTIKDKLGSVFTNILWGLGSSITLFKPFYWACTWTWKGTEYEVRWSSHMEATVWNSFKQKLLISELSFVWVFCLVSMPAVR